MTTSKPMTTIIFDDETFKRIDDFRFNNRFQSRSQAVLFLIRAGMEALKDEYPELDMSTKLETGKKEKAIQLKTANNNISSDG